MTKITIEPIKPVSAWPKVVLFCLLLGGLPGFAAPQNPLGLRYARLYERELVGERQGLMREYRALYEAAREHEPEIAEKSLYRIGLCERNEGRLEAARAVWRELLEAFPPGDPVVLAARDALKAVERELDRVEISGGVYVADGAGVGSAGKCFVFAGEWGNEPPVLTGSDGGFSMGRRAAGQLPDGRKYGLIYAAHATLPLVGAEVWVGTIATGLAVMLSAPVTLAGRVVDKEGAPVGGARVRVVGCKFSIPSHGELVESPKAKVQSSTPNKSEIPSSEGVGVGSVPSRKSEVPSSEGLGVGSAIAKSSLSAIPLPLDRLIPPVYSCSNGAFQITGLPAGLRYEITADTPEYRVVMEKAAPPVQRGEGHFGGGVDAIGLSNLFASLTWLRGDLETGAPVRWGGLAGSIVVVHFGSAYQESSLRMNQAGERGALTRLLELYGAQQVVGVWVLPAGERRGEPAQLALDLYPDLMVGAGAVGAAFDHEGLGGEQAGNVVVGRDGSILAICTDQQVFEVVKRAVGGEGR